METTHSHHLQLHNNSKLNLLKPQVKIFTVFVIVLSIAFLSLENYSIILSQTAIVIYLLWLSKLRLSTYLKRLSVDIPFVLFALFLPFLSKGNNEVLFKVLNLNVYKTGVLEMTNILIKITLCVTLAIVLTATTSNIEIIYGLQKLKISPLLIAIFSFAIRYIDVFIDEVKRVRIAMKSRGYMEKGFKGLKPLAFASGALLIRGYERGERVYNSMISRGFNGTIELKNRSYEKSNFLYLLSFLAVSNLIIDRFYL